MIMTLHAARLCLLWQQTPLRGLYLLGKIAGLTVLEHAGGTVLAPLQLSAVLHHVNARCLLLDKRHYSASHCANGKALALSNSGKNF